jgi:sterol desaturase/sphingolipid hydroxylase (fatty acid hydroxylase superfamily)
MSASGVRSATDLSPNDSGMRLSKIGYFADFFVYPCLLILLGVVGLRSSTAAARIDWALAFLAGTAIWSLLEYVAHRFVLHRVPLFRRLHAQHHAAPTALVGTPTWLSVALLAVGVFLPLWREAGVNLAGGFSAGLILGYLWYVSVHHAVHRWRARQGSYLYRAKLRHAVHHRARPSCNFGVSTGLWDLALGSRPMSGWDR